MALVHGPSSCYAGSLWVPECIILLNKVWVAWPQPSAEEDSVRSPAGYRNGNGV